MTVKKVWERKYQIDIGALVCTGSTHRWMIGRAGNCPCEAVRGGILSKDDVLMS